MTTATPLRLLTAGLCALLLGRAAEGATLCVSAAGGACETTIQAAVTAAGPGDTVNILPGTYYENVTVPAEKEGLQIVGANKLAVIVDASPYGDLGITNSGDGFRVFARNARLRNLTIRNGQRCGVDARGQGIVVQSLVVHGANDCGIWFQGWYGQALLNEIRNTTIGVRLTGFGALVRGNFISGTSSGVRIAAGGVQAVSNRIYLGSGGIDGEGDGAVIRQNDLRNQGGASIMVTGRYPTVQGNKVQGGGSVGGVVVSCTDCFGGSVSSNVVNGSAGYGVLVSADDPGMVVERNTVFRTRYGLSLNGEGIRASLNRATEIGQDYSDACFEAFGTRHTLVQNSAKACAAAGFYVAGDAHLLERNTTLGTFENGITVPGDDGAGGTSTQTTLDGNRVSGSAGQGIAVTVNAEQIIVRNNVATKNRLDFCNDGIGTVLSGNTFPTSADTGGTDCVIAH